MVPIQPSGDHSQNRTRLASASPPTNGKPSPWIGTSWERIDLRTDMHELVIAGGRRPTKQSHHADIVSSEMGARKRDCFAEFTLGLAEGETRGLVMTSYSAASAGAVTSAGKTISATGGGSRLGALSLSPTRASVARASSASRWRFHIEA